MGTAAFATVISKVKINDTFVKDLEKYYKDCGISCWAKRKTDFQIEIGFHDVQTIKEANEVLMKIMLEQNLGLLKQDTSNLK